MQMNLRIPFLDRAQHVFVKLNPQVRMQAALHQHSRATQTEHLLDFFVNGFERENVAVFRAQWPVECAERTILRAEICVIDVAVDLIRGDAPVGLLAPDFVRSHSDSDQIIGFEKVQRFLL